MKEIRKSLEKDLERENLVIDSITYDNACLNIVLDSDEVIDLDRIVKATKIINEILDKNDFIKEKYVLDVTYKEKGGK